MMHSAKKSPRSRDLALIHIAKKQLGMDEDTYRAMLLEIGNVTSAADLDIPGRHAVLEHLKAKGFRHFQKASAQRHSKPQARLIYHIWNRLYDAGVVHHLNGLDAWLQHNTRRWHPQHAGWEKPEFLPSRVAGIVIEQLKEWAKRENVKWQ